MCHPQFTGFGCVSTHAQCLCAPWFTSAAVIRRFSDPTAHGSTLKRGRSAELGKTAFHRCRLQVTSQIKCVWRLALIAVRPGWGAATAAMSHWFASRIRAHCSDHSRRSWVLSFCLWLKVQTSWKCSFVGRRRLKKKERRKGTCRSHGVRQVQTLCAKAESKLQSWPQSSVSITHGAAGVGCLWVSQFIYTKTTKQTRFSST